MSYSLDPDQARHFCFQKLAADNKIYASRPKVNRGFKISCCLLLKHIFVPVNHLCTIGFSVLYNKFGMVGAVVVYAGILVYSRAN